MRIAIAIVALLAGLLSAAAADAQTWPRDVTGTPAAECAALDSAGTPQLCGPSNPLPVTTSTSPLAGGGTASAGQSWFLSQSPSFNPFVRLDGGTSGATPYCDYLDDVNIVCFSSGTTVQQVHQWRSNDGGVTFRAVAQSAGVFGASGLEGMIRLPTGGYVFISGQISPTSPFYTSGDGITFTNRSATGIPSQVVGSPKLNVNTILAFAPNAGAGNDVVCRSPSNGTAWACAVMPAISGYDGAAGFAFSGAHGGAQNTNTQAFAPVSSGVWLATGRDEIDTNPRILRSTDDGVTWTQVFRDTGIAADNALQGVVCLSSTVCLYASGQRIARSSNGGVSWTVVVTSGPNAGNTNWAGIAAFDSTTAVAIPFGGSSTGGFSRTVDAGLTWQPQPGGTSCPRNTGVAAGTGLATVVTRNGRALVISRYLALSSGAPCAHYSALGTGGTAVTGPLGVPWAIDERGYGPVYQPDRLTPFAVAPVQGPNLFNSQTTGAANTAVVVTIAAVADVRAHVYRIEANCSAGASSVTVTDGGTTVWSTLAGEVGAAARFRQQFTPALTGGTNSAVVITLAACGVGNTGTLIVHADRY